MFNIFSKGGWIEKYKINDQVLLDFLCELEKKYNKRKNPFHNYTHGIAVMQGCYALSSCEKAK